MIHAWFASAVADPILFGTKLLLAAGVLGLLASVIRTRCVVLIEQWAERGGWEVVACRRCLLGAKPFAFTPGMPIYRVELKGPSGRQREAYIRCGNFAMSVLSDELAVEWVEADSR